MLVKRTKRTFYQKNIVLTECVLSLLCQTDIGTNNDAFLEMNGSVSPAEIIGKARPETKLLLSFITVR